MTPSPKAEPDRPYEEKPPIGGRWVFLYALVIGFLALQILVYWLFTRAFS